MVIPLFALMIAVAFILIVIRLFFKMLVEKRSQGEKTLSPSAEKGQLPSPEEEELNLAPKKMTEKERVYKLAQSDPERAADLVRRWLREEM